MSTGQLLIPDTQIRVHRSKLLAPYTTWKIGGPADYLIEVANGYEIEVATGWANDQQMPVTVIGKGSNILIGDRGIRGLVIVANAVKGSVAQLLRIVEENEHYVSLEVEATAPLPKLATYTAKRGWSGVEWGIGVPGTIGGATVTNAGIPGAEIIDCLELIEVLEGSAGASRLPASWLEAKYRHTKLKLLPHAHRPSVLRVVLRLSKEEVEAVAQRQEYSKVHRLKSQPRGNKATAGSTFRNPPSGGRAWELIDRAGLRGYSVNGRASFSTLHCNFIVTEPEATANDVRQLIELAQQKVWERFGEWLEPEIEELGDD